MAKRRALGRALTGFADAFMPAWESIERRKRLDVLDKRDEEDRALARRRTRGQDIAAAGQRIQDQWMTSEEIDALVAELKEAYPGYENFRPALEGYVPTLAQRESEFAKNENLAFMTDAQLINQAESLGIPTDSTLTSAGRLPSTQYSGAGSLPPAPDRDLVNLPALTMGAPVPTMPAGWEAGVSAGDGVPAPAASAEDIAETVARLQSSPFTAKDLSRIPDSQSWTVDQNPALNPFLTEARADAKRMEEERALLARQQSVLDRKALGQADIDLRMRSYPEETRQMIRRIEEMSEVEQAQERARLKIQAQHGIQSVAHQQELAEALAYGAAQRNPGTTETFLRETEDGQVQLVATTYRPEIRRNGEVVTPGGWTVQVIDDAFTTGQAPYSDSQDIFKEFEDWMARTQGPPTEGDPPPSEGDGASPPPGAPQNLDDVGKDSSQVLQDLGFTLENIDAIRTIGTGQARPVEKGRRALEKGGVENLQRAEDGRNNPERFATFVDAVSDVLAIPLEEMGKNQAFLDVLVGLYDQRFGPQITKQVTTKGSSDWKKRR